MAQIDVRQSLPQGDGGTGRSAGYFDEKLGELVDRGWRWQRPGWDPENKYADLREKLEPLKKKMEEGK